MSTSTSSSSNNDYESRSQQSPLASQRAKEAGNAPSAANRAGRFGNYFTLGYKESFSQWWANLPAAMAEHTVLSYVPYLQEPPTQTQTGSERPSDTKSPMPITDECSRKAAPITTDQATDPFGPRTWHSNLIKLSGKNRALNEFSVERVGECVDQNLVMLHGYGAGLGFFYKNFEGLSRARGWKLYALDLLGMGRSSRPPFKVHTKDRQGSITEAENWFIDALEEWRVQKKIERFTLLGHSLGGYLAVAYALKYPGHLNKLILASPVGIPEDVYAVNADMPDPQTSTLEQEVGQGQNAAVNNSITDGSEPRKFGDNNNFLNARSKEQANGKHADSIQPSPPRKPLPKWLTYLWDANISPFSLVRLAGPLGPRFSSGWTSRRFSHLPPDEKQALHDYAYSLFRQRGSGEYALAYILAPGAYARSPLIRRIHGVGRQMISPDGSTTSSVAAADKRRENGIPVVMIYGENDWMDIAGGYAAAKKIEEEKRRTLKELPTEERRKDNGSAKVMIINKAGHHMYLEGWEEFNDMMSKEMDEVSLKKSGKSLDSLVSV